MKKEKHFPALSRVKETKTIFYISKKKRKKSSFGSLSKGNDDFLSAATVRRALKRLC